MRQDSFCARPGQCPVQHKCARCIDNHTCPPPIRVYETFVWSEAGCEGWLSIDFTQGKPVRAFHEKTVNT